MLVFACGEIGLAEEAFWRMTLRQFSFKVDTYFAAREEEWEHTRQLMTILINANSKKKVTPQDIVELRRDKIRAWRRKKWEKSEEAERQRELIRKNWINGTGQGR